jgi:hypothetical protein
MIKWKKKAHESNEPVVRIKNLSKHLVASNSEKRAWKYIRPKNRRPRKSGSGKSTLIKCMVD